MNKMLNKSYPAVVFSALYFTAGQGAFAIESAKIDRSTLKAAQNETKQSMKGNSDHRVKIREDTKKMKLYKSLHNG